MIQKKKRMAPASYRPPVKYEEEFLSRVASSGLSKNAFITRSIFNDLAGNNSRNATMQEKDVVRLLAKCAAMKTALDKVPDRLAVELVYAELHELRAACFKLLGRQP